MSRFENPTYRDSGTSMGSVAKIGGMGLLAFVVLYAIGSFLFSVTPQAGFESVLTKHPIIWGEGGVDPMPVKSGRTFKLPWTSSTMVDMRPQQKVEHFDDLMSSDGVPLDFDAAIRLQVTNSVTLVKEFGEEWYDKNVAVEFRNRVRQAVRKHGMNETAIETKAIDAIDDEVSTAMVRYLESAKIPAILVQVTVGKANPPDAIKSQRVETAQQQQRKLTELERRDAEINRKQAEEKRADADNAYRNALSLTPAQFIALQNIKMMEGVCVHGGCTFVVTGGQSGIMVNATERPSARPTALEPQEKK